ncbi:MAG: hypothetical protein ABI682_15100 [Acidobacteriota bacterium]
MSERDDSDSGGFGPEDMDDTAEFGIGKSHNRELETDGPVMGGPGMVRTGGDRAVSTGTGGLAAGEDLDPVAEGDYWRENFRRRPYYEAQKEYSDYEPSYRYGWERAGQSEYRNRGFEEVELDLKRDWEASNTESLANWDQARDPARDAFERARGGRGGPGDKDRDDDDS